MAASEQFSLRWNNFHSNLSTGFQELLRSADMVDVTLAVEGHFFQAHKLVLSICSPYFRQMFRANPCKHPIVILKDVAHGNMKDILEFMYVGEVNVLRENLGAFLRTAELLQVKGLTGDDSSDTSSRKDEKADSLPDEDSDIAQFTNLLESEVELPQHYSTPRRLTPPPPHIPPASINKRHARHNLSSHSKRPKTEAVSAVGIAKTTIKQENDGDGGEGGDVEGTIETGEEIVTKGEGLEDAKEVKMENNGGEHGLSDQESLGMAFATEHKLHFFCPFCCRKFVNRYNMKVHIRDKHENSNPGGLDCSICGKSMRNKSCLRVHMYHHRKQTMTDDGHVMV